MRTQYHDDYGIFVGTGGALTQVADSTTGDLTFFMPPSINNAGNVAFAAIVNGDGDGVYLASAGGLTELVNPNHPLIGGLIGLAAINDAGTVAFAGQTNDSVEFYR